MSITYRSVAGDAFFGELKEVIIVPSKSKNRGKSDSLADVIQAVLVGEDTNGDFEVIITTVGANVVGLIIIVGVFTALKEIRKIDFVIVPVHVRAVGVVVVASVVVTVLIVLFVLVLAVVTRGFIHVCISTTLVHLLHLVVATASLVPDTVGSPVTTILLSISPVGVSPVTLVIIAVLCVVGVVLVVLRVVVGVGVVAVVVVGIVVLRVGVVRVGIVVAVIVQLPVVAVVVLVSLVVVVVRVRVSASVVAVGVVVSTGILLLSATASCRIGMVVITTSIRSGVVGVSLRGLTGRIVVLVE